MRVRVPVILNTHTCTLHQIVQDWAVDTHQCGEKERRIENRRSGRFHKEVSTIFTIPVRENSKNEWFLSVPQCVVFGQGFYALDTLF